MTADTGDRLALAPPERRALVLSFIGGAQCHLALALGRCSDFGIVEALGAAVDRGVHVDVLVPRLTKGWGQVPDGLVGILTATGAHVRRWHDESVRYHVKLGVADGQRAFVGSLNFTRGGFERTVDVVLVTSDPPLVDSLSRLFRADFEATPWTPALQTSDRLLVGPDGLRAGVTAAVAGARRSISILDHKFRDPSLRALVENRRTDGLAITLVGAADVQPYRAHGRLIVVDDERAWIGSASLSTGSLAARRDVLVEVTDPGLVRRLSVFLRWATEHGRAEPDWTQPDEVSCDLLLASSSVPA